MLVLLLLLYLLPIYLVFFRFKLLTLTPIWRVFLWIPPLLAAVFLWFALGRYTPTVATAYVQAPVVQVAAEVSGVVTRVPVSDNLSVTANQPLLELEQQPYQQQLAQATAKAIEAKQSFLVQYAGVYAARENLTKAETGINVAKKKLESARLNLQTAEQSEAEIAKQLEVAESILARTAELLEAKAVSRDEWERASSSAAAVRTQSLEARNRIASSLAEVEIAELQSLNADAAVREARAVLVKSELMVEPVDALRNSIERRQAALDATRASATEGELAALEKEVAQLRSFLQMAEATPLLVQAQSPGVQAAEEAARIAAYNLDRSVVRAPVSGTVSNLHVTPGTYARAGSPLVSLIDGSSWKMIAAVPENWLELIRPGDEVIYSLRNYPGRLARGKVESVGRGVLQGQGIPSGTLADTDPRRTRQSDTPQAGQEFQVVIRLADDKAEQPLRVGATGRMTILAGGGMPGVNQLASILHFVFSLTDYFYPQPGLLTMLLVAGLGIGAYLFSRQQ